MFKWEKIAAGYYHAIRDGEHVATAERVRDTGEPLWRLLPHDGTPLHVLRSGREHDTFVTLGDAQFTYARQYMKANGVRPDGSAV